jgi:hypothetical protein
MKNDYKKATDVLSKAQRAINDGTEVHGDTYRSFEMIGQLWATYIGHTMTIHKKIALTPRDVATMMMMVKQVRSVYGHTVDNYVDAAGYAALAAMLDPMGRINDDLDLKIDESKGDKDAVRQ